jgi:hypothetical protein
VSGWKRRHKGLTVDDVVMQKAVELYNHYAESGHDYSCCFHASKRWSENLKVWTGLQKVKCIGESATADYMAGTYYPMYI